MTQVDYVFFKTTADDERDYFYGDIQMKPLRFSNQGGLVPGNYRVMVGELFQILPGVPPKDD